MKDYSNLSKKQLLKKLNQQEAENLILKTSWQLFTEGPVAIFKWKNAEGWPVEYASPNVIETFGYSADEFCSGKVMYSSIIFEKDIEKVVEEVAEAGRMELGILNHEPYRIIHKDGSERWLQDHTCIIRNDDNEVTHYNGYVFDITNQQNSNAQLKANEIQAQSILNGASSLIYVKNLDGEYLKVNSSFKELYNLRRDQIIGKRDSDIFAKELADTYRDNDLKVQKTAKLLKFEELATYAGGVITFLSIKFPLFNANKEMYGVCGISSDISDYKKILNSLEVTKNQLNESQLVANMGSWDISLSTGHVHWSEERYRLLGYQPYSVNASSDTFMQTVYPDDRGKVLEVMASAMNSANEGSYFIEHRVTLKKGEIRYLEERGFVDFDKTGIPIRMYGTSIDITRQKRLEKKLQFSRDQHNEAQRLSHLGHWDYWPEKENIFWSDEVYEIFEVSKSEFKPTYEGFLDLIHPDDRDKVHKAYQESTVNHVPYKVTHRLLLNDGREKFILERGKTTFNSAGEIINSFGTTQDVTSMMSTQILLNRIYDDMKLKPKNRSRDLPILSQQILKGVLDHLSIENELREERDFIDSLINTAQVVILVLDTKGHIVRFNPYLEKLSGYSLSEVKGKNWFKTLLPRIDNLRVNTFFNSVKSDIPPNGNINPILAKNGREYFIEWWSTMLHNPDGNVIGVLSVGQDVTQNRLLQAELDSERIRLRTLIEESSAYICFKDSEGHWLEANRALLNLFGVNDVDFKGKSNKDMISLASPHSRKMLKACSLFDNLAWESGKPIKFELEFSLSDGLKKTIEFTKQPLLNKDKTLLVIGHDITERKQIELKRLNEIKKQRDTLVNEVHHRIKNHLQGLKGLLSLRKNQEQENIHFIKEIISQVDSIAIVYGLQSEYSKSEVNYTKMQQAILSSIRGLNPEHNIYISETTAPVEYSVDKSNAVAVALIINELLTNAVKHSKFSQKENSINVLSSYEDDVIILIINNPGSLPVGFNFLTGEGAGTGLDIVKTMLPSKGTKLTFSEKSERVMVKLEMSFPLIIINETIQAE